MLTLSLLVYHRQLHVFSPETEKLRYTGIMRARPDAEGINEIKTRYDHLQSDAKKLGLNNYASAIALERVAGAIDTVSVSGLPWLLQKPPTLMDHLRRGTDLELMAPDIAIEEERRGLIIAAGAVGLHGFNVKLCAVFDPTALANTADDKPRSVREKREAAAHILQLAAHPFLDSDFRINEAGIAAYHPAYDEVTVYRATPGSQAIGASAITNTGSLEVFQAPENIAKMDAYVEQQIRAAHESRPVGRVALDGLTNHLDLIAGIASGEY